MKKLLSSSTLIPITLLASALSLVNPLTRGFAQAQTSGVEIMDVTAHCDPGAPDLCESWIPLLIENVTSQPQQFVVVRANIYDASGNALTNTGCFSGYDIIALDAPLGPGESVITEAYLRKAMEYASAEVVEVEWHGTSRPSANEVFPAAQQSCPQ